MHVSTLHIISFSESKHFHNMIITRRSSSLKSTACCFEVMDKASLQGSFSYKENILRLWREHSHCSIIEKYTPILESTFYCFGEIKEFHHNIIARQISIFGEHILMLWRDQVIQPQYHCKADFNFGEHILMLWRDQVFQP